MDAEKFADQTRSMIEHENTLENNRLNWLLIAQGLLFAAVGVAIQAKVSVIFIYICAVAGLTTSFSAGTHLRHGRRAMNDLLKEFKEKFPDYDGPRIIGLDMEEELSFRERYIIPPYFLPWVFIALWFAISLLANLLVRASP
ncbi:MAG: hypothetical protein ACYSWR_03985 [Planctomycetota bacterium]|jgi:hypothetical protein